MKTETTPKAETESRTRIQAYSKSQLAGLYLPHIQSASARRTLRSWIAKNTALQAALAQTGYSEKAILLTPAQVRPVSYTHLYISLYIRLPLYSFPQPESMGHAV